MLRRASRAARIDHHVDSETHDAALFPSEAQLISIPRPNASGLACGGRGRGSHGSIVAPVAAAAAPAFSVVVGLDAPPPLQPHNRTVQTTARRNPGLTFTGIRIALFLSARELMLTP
jgi:hypothetical protein